MSSRRKSAPLVTSYEAARAVQLKKEWQERYRARAKEVMQVPTFDGQFAVSIVGRAGVGKGALVNHLLKRRAALVSHNASGNDSVAQSYCFGRFKLTDVPGYDGQHSLAAKYKAKKGSSAKPEGGLTLEQFVESYNLFGSDTNALIFVVNNRITVHDKELMALAVASRKFFCIVRTHADSEVRIVDSDERAARLSEMEQEIRDELHLTKNLNIRIFKASIPWPERKISGDELENTDLERVVENAQALDFPLLAKYLSGPGGLYEELKIHLVVKDLVGESLEPYIHVKKRRMFVEFAEHGVLGVLVPFVGPLVLTFVSTLIHTIRALGAAGLVEDTDKAVEKVVGDAKYRKLVGAATKEELANAFKDTLIHIFGETIYHIAIYDLAILTADATVTASLPVVGAFVSAARLPSRYEKIGDLLSQKACMLHELWIMQNVTNLTQLS